MRERQLNRSNSDEKLTEKIFDTATAVGGDRVKNRVNAKSLE